MSVIPFQKQSALLEKIDRLEIELGRLLHESNVKRARENKLKPADIKLRENTKPQNYCNLCHAPIKRGSFCDNHQPKVNAIDPMSVRGRMLTAAVLLFIISVFFGYLTMVYGG